jgi:hypothetical protein
MNQNVLEGFTSDWPPAAAAEPASAGPPVPPVTSVEARNPAGPRRWSVVMTSGPRRLVEARGFRIESGAVVFAEPAGCVAAFESGIWSSIEEDRSNA